VQRPGVAKGLRDRVLKYRYAGRTALLPVVSLMAIHVGTMVT
jgi:ABC-type dipeptide/oligopeptide/nickel transport system permease component